MTSRSHSGSWLLILLTAWLVLAAHVVGPKPASGAFYGATEHVRGATIWKALPLLEWTRSRAAIASGASVATNNTVVASYGPLNPGPLSADIASTFRSGTYTEMVAQQPTTLYRVYGGSAGQMGGCWTQTPFAGPVQSIIDSALLPQWDNTATNVVKIEIPAGINYFTSAAAPQGGLVGGGNQVVFPAGFRVNPSWIKTP